jgi:hypothetical protein
LHFKAIDWKPGLPDGIFSNQKSKFAQFLEGLAMEDAGYILWTFGLCIVQPFSIFCGHLVYFMVIWYILWPFGIFYGYLVYFVAIWSRFGML